MKMDKQQKQFRKVALAELLNRGGIVATDGFNMTAVFVPSFRVEDNGHFSLSYAGNEKFKCKYGEWVALDRLYYGECLPITQEDFYHFCDSFNLDIRENDPPISAAKSQPLSNRDMFGLIPEAAWPFPAQ